MMLALSLGYLQAIIRIKKKDGINTSLTIKRSLASGGGRMNKIIVPLFIFIFLLVIDQTFAADKVVVIPLHSSAGSSANLWGEGRVGVSATTVGSANGIKIARSNSAASWDGVAAACPRDTWVCTEAEVKKLSTNTTLLPLEGNSCDGSSYMTASSWVEDQGQMTFGRAVQIIGGVVAGLNFLKCYYLPVMCCSTM
jgi:hypothetical protein